ncbi:DUF1996 domain-containing protein [Nocardiopsis rhodophaea]|uniref:DUF1996 domain-containing protein n=1 Tax=Nocardiopsis rhodophaea TaxID=280238 RepID=UPI0033815155
MRKHRQSTRKSRHDDAGRSRPRRRFRPVVLASATGALVLAAAATVIAFGDPRKVEIDVVGFGSAADGFGGTGFLWGGGDGKGGGYGLGGGVDIGGRTGDIGNQRVTGPAGSDFARIELAPPLGEDPQARRSGSTGTFISDCGTNGNRLFNSENVIVAPGVENGAQHTHDYVGNQNVQNYTEDVGTNNVLLAQGQTSCADQRDQSTYYWPVLRDINGVEFDANAPGGGADGNVGRILEPKSAVLEFRGNPRSEVVPMAPFLQIITGNARAFTTGGDNANAKWTCTGFEGQAFADKYPLCPEGSDVVRIADFPSCWDGENIESEDNRSHIVFPRRDGQCPRGTVAVPQLRQTLVYEVPPGKSFAVDGFPEERRNPITDHSDFINVMSPDLMREVVDCINDGRECRTGQNR